MQLLLSCGAHPDPPDESGLTPLMLLVREVCYGHHAVAAAAVLLSYGANPRAVDAAARTPLHHAGACYGDPALWCSPSPHDVLEDVQKIRAVTRQLLLAGADPNALDAEGCTPMGAAAATGNAAAVVAFMSEGMLPPQAPLSPVLVQRMALVRNMRREQQWAAALQARADALWAARARVEEQQVAQMAPGVWALVAGAEVEVKRLRERWGGQEQGVQEGEGSRGASQGLVGQGFWEGQVAERERKRHRQLQQPWGDEVLCSDSSSCCSSSTDRFTAEVQSGGQSSR